MRSEVFAPVFLVLAVCGSAAFCVHAERTRAEPSHEEKVRAWNEARAKEQAAFRRQVESCRRTCAPYRWSYGDRAAYIGGQGCVCSSGMD